MKLVECRCGAVCFAVYEAENCELELRCHRCDATRRVLDLDAVEFEKLSKPKAVENA